MISNDSTYSNPLEGGELKMPTNIGVTDYYEKMKRQHGDKKAVELMIEKAVQGDIALYQHRMKDFIPLCILRMVMDIAIYLPPLELRKVGNALGVAFGSHSDKIRKTGKRTRDWLYYMSQYVEREVRAAYPPDKKLSLEDGEVARQLWNLVSVLDPDRGGPLAWRNDE